MLSSFFQEPAVIGLVIGIPSAVLGVLGYRRAVRVDRVAEQAGIATKEERSVGQVFDGLNSIISNLQRDNETVRARVERIEARLDASESRNSALERENVALHEEIEELRAENAELKGRIVELEKLNG